MVRVAVAGLMMAAMAASAEVGPVSPETVFHDEIEVVDRAIGAWPVAAGQAVIVSFRAGELVLSVTDDAEVATELTVQCPELSTERCDRYRAKARLAVRSEGDAVRVGLTGVPLWRMRRLRLHGEIRFPRRTPLELSMGAGAVEVISGEADVTVRLRVGDLVVRAPRPAIASVAMRAGIGDVSLDAGGVPLDGRRRRLLGNSLEWDAGEGAARVDVRMTIGAAEVILEEGGRIGG